jgi:hypothetical protein
LIVGVFSIAGMFLIAGSCPRLGVWHTGNTAKSQYCTFNANLFPVLLDYLEWVKTHNGTMPNHLQLMFYAEGKAMVWHRDHGVSKKQKQCGIRPDSPVATPTIGHGYPATPSMDFVLGAMSTKGRATEIHRWPLSCNTVFTLKGADIRRHHAVAPHGTRVQGTSVG